MKMKKDNATNDKDLKYNPEITKEDKDLLRQDNAHLHSDASSDELLRNRKDNVDFAGKDLDIPGRNEAKKGNGPNGLNDEENKIHSQGGERNNNLERNDASR